jgi:hypothetical protein
MKESKSKHNKKSNSSKLLPSSVELVKLFIQVERSISDESFRQVVR